MTSFTLQVAEFAEQFKADTKEIVTKAVLEVYAGVVKKSPVLSGRFRGNWQVTRSGPAAGVVPTTDRRPLGDKPGEEVAHRARLNMLDFKIGETVYITNHLPYANRLEYEGWSQQAPSGMVRLTVLSWQDYIAKAARETQ